MADPSTKKGVSLTDLRLAAGLLDAFELDDLGSSGKFPMDLGISESEFPGSPPWT